jgi:Ca2+-binding RTX toxin-like protein
MRVIAIFASMLALPASASAATVSVDGAVLRVTGTAGSERIDFDQLNGGPIAITNLGRDDALDVGAGCVKYALSFQAYCAPDGIERVVVDLKGGDDEYLNGRFSLPVQVDGGPGDDILNDSDGVNELNGGDGDDILFMDSGPDSGADVLWGGPGYDRASYGQWRGDGKGLRLSLDDLANDGVAGEGDNIHTDIEALNGGYADDVLIGSPDDDELAGGTGDDELYGLGGDDLLDGGNEINDGGADTDRLSGGDGFDVVDYSQHWNRVFVSLDGQANDGPAGENDHVLADVEGAIGGYAADLLTGNAGDGVLDGLEGNDLIIDPGGEDLLAGGEGDDEIEAADQASDAVLCGEDSDHVWRDAADDVDGCEVQTSGPRSAEPSPTPSPAPTAMPTPTPIGVVRRPRPTPVPRAAPVPADTTAPSTTVLRATSRARAATLRHNGLVVTVRCNELCRVSAELKGRRGGVVATGARRGLSYAARRLRLNFTAAGKRALRPGIYQLAITLTDRAGNSNTIVRSLRVR